MLFGQRDLVLKLCGIPRVECLFSVAVFYTYAINYSLPRCTASMVIKLPMQVLIKLPGREIILSCVCLPVPGCFSFLASRCS